ncbi:hypothetical protein DFH06DRAFT_483982 [Mycena polygramma]|nr:hypothetical protein DFH06DRAFT_483982 [Mycena polygramma]
MLTLDADRARVAELVPKIAALRREEEQAQARLDAYKYPVLTLANEIVSEVFAHFLPSYPSFPPLTGILSPTTLTHICRHWREVAVATPRIWRAISVSRETPVALRLFTCEIWLKRSRNSPLSIAIDRDCLTSEILSVIIPHRARWEHIEFSLSPSDLPTIVGPMPLLQHLDLSVDEEVSLLVELFSVPKLRSVVLTKYGTPNITLPWAQLTVLTLDTLYRDEYIPILRQTPNLRQCTLVVLLESEDPSSQRQELTLPYLESLTIDTAAHSDAASRIPDIFIVPALGSLNISESLLGCKPVDTLRAFISTAGCILEKVHITARRTIDMDSLCKVFGTVEFSFDDWHDSIDSSDSSDEGDSSDGEWSSSDQHSLDRCHNQ